LIDFLRGATIGSQFGSLEIDFLKSLDWAKIELVLAGFRTWV